MNNKCTANGLWATIFSDQEIVAQTPLSHSSQHQLTLIQLADNSLWVGKVFSATNWLGDVTQQQLNVAESMSVQVEKQLNISYAAYHHKVYLTSAGFAVLRPYYPGKIVTKVGPEQAMILGELLAKIHKIKLIHENALPFPNVTWPSDVSIDKKIHHIIARCNNIEANATWLVSHRDSHCTNIVWGDVKTPHLLDWESCGLIHPGIELIGLALNCAGIVNNKVDPVRFSATLSGYRKILELPTIEEENWCLIFHSWLLWGSYLFRLGKKKEAAGVVKMIGVIMEGMSALRELY